MEFPIEEQRIAENRGGFEAMLRFQIAFKGLFRLPISNFRFM
jgi:hypothetical protein